MQTAMLSQQILAYTPEQLSAFAALCSAVAALALGVIGILTWRATKKMSNATVEMSNATDDYVKATKEIVAITHNPVLGIEIRQLDARENDDRVTVNYDLVNLGNAPAIGIYSVVRIEGSFGNLCSAPPAHVLSYIGVSREKQATSTLNEATIRLLEYMQKAAAEFFKENPLCRARSSLLASIFATLHGPKIIVTAIYKNHLGQHYRSVLQAYLLPLPWNETSPTGVQLERNAGVEFDFDDMQPEEYMAERLAMVKDYGDSTDEEGQTTPPNGGGV